MSTQKLKSIKQVTEGLARGVSKYVQINYKLPHKTSNGYMKLWEIYMSVPQLILNKKEVNVWWDKTKMWKEMTCLGWLDCQIGSIDPPIPHGG